MGKFGRPRRPVEQDVFSKIVFDPVHPELFNEVAEGIARKLNERRNANKPTQLRRFYNELLMWEDKIAGDPNKFTEMLPLIKMLNAKVAYAKSRDNVDEQFSKFIRTSLNKVNSVESLHRFKLLFEAVLGFYRSVSPRGWS